MWDNIIAYNQRRSQFQLTQMEVGFREMIPKCPESVYVIRHLMVVCPKLPFTNKHHWLGCSIFHFQKKIQRQTRSLIPNTNLGSHTPITLTELADLLGADAYMPLYDQNQVGSQYRETSYPINIF
jgi:hypothetical protein